MTKVKEIKLPQVVLISDEGDWEGLFYNGQRYSEGHSIPATDVLDMLEEKGIIKFEAYSSNMNPYRHSNYEDTVEKNAAAGIIDEPEER